MENIVTSYMDRVEGVNVRIDTFVDPKSRKSQPFGVIVSWGEEDPFVYHRRFPTRDTALRTGKKILRDRKSPNSEPFPLPKRGKAVLLSDADKLAINPSDVGKLTINPNADEQSE